MIAVHVCVCGVCACVVSVWCVCVCGVCVCVCACVYVCVRVHVCCVCVLCVLCVFVCVRMSMSLSRSMVHAVETFYLMASTAYEGTTVPRLQPDLVARPFCSDQNQCWKMAVSTLVKGVYSL